MNWKKKIIIAGASIFTILLLLFYLLVYPKLLIVSGYVAKNVCSCIFVASIEEQIAVNEDINFGIMHLASTTVNYSNKTVTASVLGMHPKTAYYANNTGCALVNSISPNKIYTYTNKWAIPKYDSLENWFNYIDTVEYLTVNQHKKLFKVINSAFIEEDPLQKKKNTRAALVLYKGQLIEEQYAEKFTKNSRLLGWSMTKSLTASMLSMLAHKGKLNLNEPTNIKEWQHDNRRNITWKQLLQMNSGLKWKEDYADITDAVKMFFKSDGAGKYAVQLPLDKEPNTHWEYSSGTTNIIAKAMRSYFNSDAEYVRYIYANLFYKIGMYSMLIETDAEGIFVGSSYSWATARDWAKFGQLYLQNGNWAGEQLLSEDWVEFVQQPAPNSNKRYGGHFWLNKGGFYPNAPKDMYALNGFMGQYVFIIPSKELVIVRLGLTENRDDFDFNAWLTKIIAAIEN
ncbi:MAG: beta-lactamase family protein [Cyclobacteriaceae bacterium]|nr:beta-lactamase family protein [Cyclobacteriaceae bacterium]